MSVCRNDVLVAASVALYDGEVGGGVVQSVACVGVGVGSVVGYGVFPFLAGLFSLVPVFYRA